MTKEEEATETLEQEVVTEAPAEPGETGTDPPAAAPPPQVSPETETKARDMGWMPKEQWVRSGRDPEAHRPANEFLRRGEEVLPIIKSRAQKAEAKVHSLVRTRA